MAERSYWKGHLRLSLVSCAVALYPATGSSGQHRFHTLNRQTGNRIAEEVVDSVTRDPVPRDERVKGYEVAKGDYVAIEEEELDRIRLESTHTINIESFVDRAKVDERYLDRPYYLAPEDKVSREAFAVMRDAMREKKKAGLGRLVLARRERIALIEPFDKGMLVTTLRSAGEVRSPTAIFEDIAEFEAPDDMRQLAAQLIERASVPFDPRGFEDRYEQALSALIEAKTRPGKPSRGRAANDDEAPAKSNVVNLMDALKRSIQGPTSAPVKATAASKAKPARREAAASAPAKGKRAVSRLKKAG